MGCSFTRTVVEIPSAGGDSHSCKRLNVAVPSCELGHSYDCVVVPSCLILVGDGTERCTLHTVTADPIPYRFVVGTQSLYAVPLFLSAVACTTCIYYSRKREIWLQRLESNQLPQGYEPCELPVLYSAIERTLLRRPQIIPKET